MNRESFIRAVQPVDLRAQKFLWERTPENSWSDEPLRATVLAFLNGFLDANPWACEWSVVEKFARPNRASLTEWKRRTGTSLIESQKGFLIKRGAYPTLVLHVVRKDGFDIEISLPFPRGSETESVEMLLDVARKHFVMVNRGR